MKPDWLKARDEHHWTTQLGPYSGSVGRTMFGDSYTYCVSNGVRVVRSGNVRTLEEAQAAAEGAAGELG